MYEFSQFHKKSSEGSPDPKGGFYLLTQSILSVRIRDKQAYYFYYFLKFG